MNKLFNKIATGIVGIALAIGVGVAVGSGTKNAISAKAGSNTSSLIFTKACGGSGTANDGAKWTVTSDGTESSFDSDRGIHYGTNSAQVKYIQLSTSDISGTVTSIVVHASGNNNPSLSCTVGGSSFGTTATNITTSDSEYTFTGSGNAGEIVVLLTKASAANKALYIKSIVVTYDSGSGTSIVIDKNTFTTVGSGSGYTPYNGARNIGDYSIWSYQTMIQSNNVQFQRNAGWITNKTPFDKIKKIVLSDSSNMVIYLSTTAFDTSTNSRKTSSTTTTSGTTISGTYNYFAVYDTYTSSSTKSLASITIEYESFTKHTATWKNWDGSTLETDSVIEGETPTYSGSTPTRAQDAQYTYVFSGWSPTPEAIYEDTIYTAQYNSTVRSYTVSFNVQGHGKDPGNQTIQYNGKVTQPTAPSATGYTFGGWYKESGCTNAWNFNNDVITGARILYAKWTANKYNINYYDKGGSAFSGTHATGYPTQHTYGTTTTLKTATKVHYSFGGWFTSTDCSGTAVTSLGATAYTDAINLYAKWTIDDYAITGHITNGSLSSTERVDYYEPLSITIVPADGYTYPSSLDSVTMGGEAYHDYTYSSSDGVFSITHVTGDVVITASCPDPSATEYSVDYDLSNCSIEDAPESMYSNEIKELQIVPDEHYKLPLEEQDLVSVTGISADKWSYDEDDGTIIISEPDGNMTVSVQCVAKVQNTIGMGTLTGVIPAAGNPDSVEEGEVVSLTFTASSGYGLPGNDGVTVTGAGSTWNQGTGTLQITGGTSREIKVSIIGIQRDLTDGNLTLGAKKTSYTLGDDFELPSTITANFNIAPLTVDVKNDVVISGPITNGVVSGSGTVTLTYTYETTGKTQTASYSVTATPIVPTVAKYVKVTSSNQLTTGQYLIVCENSSVAFDGSLTSFSTGNNVDVEINSSNEIAYSNETKAIEFTINVTDKTIYSKSGYYINNAGDSNNMTYTSSSAANKSFAITDGNFVAIGSGGSYLRFNSSSGQECFKYFKSSTYTGQKAVQLYKYQAGTVKELKWITATVNEGTYYQGTTVTSNNFTVTAHYNGGTQEDPQSEVVTENITVTNGYLNNIGNNEVTLTYGGKSCNVNVVAVEQTAALTGLSWAQGELTIIDGNSVAFSELGTITASYEGGLSSTIAISSCTVSIYTKESETYTKVSDIADGTTITSTSHGKYLGVTYTEKTVTKVAYSSAPIYVVESINSVYNKEKTFSWELVSSISVGDTVVFTGTKADGTEPNELTGVSETTGTIAAFETTTPSGTYKLTVVEGASDGQFAFEDENGNYLSHSGTDKTLSLSGTINSNSSWTVQFDNNEPTKAIILNAYSSNPLQYNPGNCFRVYSSASQQPVKIYKGEEHYSPVGSDIANTDTIAQKYVLEYAKHFNEVMNCIQGGTTDNVSGKWSDLSDDFQNWFFDGDITLTEEQQADVLALFAGADAKDSKIGGDTLQDMLARYEYICHKYKLDDFLHEKADRPPVPKRGNFSPLLNISVNANAAASIIIVSAISLAAIVGYFFLRKKKED